MSRKRSAWNSVQSSSTSRSPPRSTCSRGSRPAIWQLFASLVGDGHACQAGVLFLQELPKPLDAVANANDGRGQLDFLAEVSPLLGRGFDGVSPHVDRGVRFEFRPTSPPGTQRIPK